MKTFELNVETDSEETAGLTIREVVEKIEDNDVSDSVVKPFCREKELKIKIV